mgnify:CR=1 FL=1
MVFVDLTAIFRQYTFCQGEGVNLGSYLSNAGSSSLFVGSSSLNVGTCRSYSHAVFMQYSDLR